jgi:uncharacterized protein (TIGR03083 family)
VALSRAVVVPGMLDEYRRFGELLSRLSPEELMTPTRCAGWSVADVAGHVIGQLTDVTSLQLDGLGSDEVTQREVDDRRGRTLPELADELSSGIGKLAELMNGIDDVAWSAPLPGGLDGTLGFGIEALLFDTAVHADDVRQALGQPSSPGDAANTSLSHIAQTLTDQGWGPASLALTGAESFQVSGGGGRRVTGDAFAFILVASGRGDPGDFDLDPTVNIYR